MFCLADFIPNCVIDEVMVAEVNKEQQEKKLSDKTAKELGHDLHGLQTAWYRTRTKTTLITGHPKKSVS